MFELVYAFTCLDLQVYGGVLSRDAYETVGVTDDVRARLRALTCASARSSRIRRGGVTESGNQTTKMSFWWLGGVGLTAFRFRFGSGEKSVVPTVGNYITVGSDRHDVARRRTSFFQDCCLLGLMTT